MAFKTFQIFKIQGLIFFLSCNNTDKAKLKMELEVLGRMLSLKWHIRDDIKDVHHDVSEPKSKFNPHNRDAVMELYLSGFVVKVVIKSADEGLAVVM